MDMDKDNIWPLDEMKSGEGGKYLENSYFRADSYERFCVLNCQIPPL